VFYFNRKIVSELFHTWVQVHEFMSPSDEGRLESVHKLPMLKEVTVPMSHPSYLKEK